jgi:hypothetical protein
VQGTVQVATVCAAARRCQQSHDVYHGAVQFTVQVATVCDAARRCLQSHDVYHGAFLFRGRATISLID